MYIKQTGSPVKPFLVQSETVIRVMYSNDFNPMGTNATPSHIFIAT